VFHYEGACGAVAEQISNFLNLPSFTMPAFSFTSILDIALIAFAVYKLLSWIKQTRAWALFKGIATLAVVYLAAEILDMHVTQWLINQTLAFAVIALIVVFQPEVRRALEKMGKGRRIPFLSMLVEEDKNEDTAACVDEIIVAAIKMSKTRTGALMVIEQETPLGDLEASGVRVDAVVSSQLLLSIFEDKTPLHDGAVLIGKGRVKSAACILPLTEKNLGGDLGTRHRAAVGASEISDAYALVVSEESGAISIARDGKLHQKLTEDEIRNMLMSGVAPIKLRRKKKKKG